MKRLPAYTLSLALASALLAQENFTISGYITDASNSEALIGTTVLFDVENQKGAIANYYGFYSLTIPAGKVSLLFSFVGFESKQVQVDLTENKTLNVALQPSAGKLSEVVITSDRFVLEEEVKKPQMGIIQLTPKEVEAIPALGGEVDLIKVAQLMPGISRGGEGTTGMYVRGGTDDQNLVTIDEATVYNVGHLFGFFSIFNNDAIRDVKLVKGGFPAQYGGRLSSVMDVRLKEGDLQRWHGRGGIGLLSSRLTIDGPIIQDKLSIMLSGRRTYIDQMLRLTGVNLPYYFYDFNGKISYKIDRRNRIYLSAYLGDDVLDFNETVTEENEEGIAEKADEIENELSFGFKLGNITSTLRWNHIYNNEKLFHNLTLFNTQFDYDIGGNFIDNSILIRSSIRDYGLKADWDYFYSPDISLKWGFNTVTHLFRPNVVNTGGDISEALGSREGDLIVNQEAAIYANNEHNISNRWSTNYGFRISSSIVEGAFYAGFEPRLTARYAINKLNSIKFSYTYMKQYMHRVSSSSISLPTDLWYPVTASVKPQASHQVAVGYFTGIEKWNLSISSELYFKTMSKLIEYREGARLILNDNFEEELINGDGQAYGAEFLARKKVGKFTGWLGYSIAKANRSFTELNRGQTYPARYDRRHDVSMVANFDITPRFAFSMVWVYSSGSRFTAQNGQYFFPNPSFTGVELVPVFTPRNEVTLASSHRLDANFIIKNKPTKWFSSEWHFGFYNFYNRASPYQVRVQFDGLNYRYVQDGLFGFIPSIAWNFNF
ncbi:MAG: TonB-dependent receptor [Bacteroidota bacterium]